LASTTSLTSIADS